MKLQKLYSSAIIPSYATAGSAGLDLSACISAPLTLQPGERAVIQTGIAIELPHGFEAQIRPRSGLAAKHGVTVLNAPGTIDSDYRGQIGVILINLGDRAFTISDGDRIAQMVIARHEHFASLDVVDDLSETERGEGGFGSTGR